MIFYHLDCRMKKKIAILTRTGRVVRPGKQALMAKNTKILPR
jgi:hypothetical protein